jgi:hypothetical protein
MTQGRVEYESTIPRGTDEGSDSWEAHMVISCCLISQDYAPVLLPGGVCVYEFLWRTPAACPVNLKTEPPQEDDSCTVAVPGTNNRYGDVSEWSLTCWNTVLTL